MKDSIAIDITIAESGTLSSVLTLPGEFYLGGIIHPVMTTSTAFTFQVSDDNVTYYPLVDEGGTSYSITIDPATAEAVVLDPSGFYCWKYIKLVVADAQAAARTIKCIIKPY